MKILTDVFPVIIAAIFGSERCGPDVEKAIGVGTKYLTVYHNMKNTMFLDPRDCFYLIRTNRTSAEYSNVEIGNFFADALYKTETRMRITSFKRDGPRDRIDILDPGASDARDAAVAPSHGTGRTSTSSACPRTPPVTSARFWRRLKGIRARLRPPRKAVPV
ncbi:uncharacterized protein LOC144176041 isoform X4 [Haemaphysalis longicornis]